MKNILYILILVILGMSLLALARGEEEYETVTVTVVEGDTAWEIVDAHNGSINMNQAIYEFKQLNNGVSLQPGQEVLVPVYRGEA